MPISTILKKFDQKPKWINAFTILIKSVLKQVITAVYLHVYNKRPDFGW